MPSHDPSSTKIVIRGAELAGNWSIPNDAQRLVLFAHGSGSSRLSTRNRHVAHLLNQANIGTLLFDLLTEAEERVDAHTAELRFDIPFLASRLLLVTDWATEQPQLRRTRIGYFGASTGAAAALEAAAQSEHPIGAVVSRGGRPDLAVSWLGEVKAPTLLIVGELDREVIRLNRQALEMLPGATRLEIIPGATHLFEEKGALEAVAGLAREWFLEHL